MELKKLKRTRRLLNTFIILSILIILTIWKENYKANTYLIGFVVFVVDIILIIISKRLKQKILLVESQEIAYRDNKKE